MTGDERYAEWLQLKDPKQYGTVTTDFSRIENRVMELLNHYGNGWMLFMEQEHIIKGMCLADGKYKKD
jgi:hypothetical protein